MKLKEFVNNLSVLCEQEAGDYPICINNKFVEMYPIAGIQLRNEGMVSIFSFPAHNAPYIKARYFLKDDIMPFIEEKRSEQVLEKDLTVSIITKNGDFQIESVGVGNLRICVNVKDAPFGDKNFAI